MNEFANNEVQSTDDEPEQQPPQWQPLTRLQRRVAGVLVEKAKTTPDAYPMTVNAIRNACNQKSNRSPVMNVDEDDVVDTLYELRQMKAITEVHGGGRVPKYRQYLSEWLGIDATELAVMAELLLRGEQSLGDLRARSSRMKKIETLAELKPVVASLIEKNLIVELTPAGRGQVVTHNLYQGDELQRLQGEFERGAPAASGGADRSPPRPPPEPASPAIASSPVASRVEQLENEVAELKEQLERLSSRIDELTG
ncbi:MAG: DUF480 domain-containing protein [Planctomycetota bacterium]